MTALLLPPPPLPPSPHAAKEQRSQEPGPCLMPTAALLGYSTQNGSAVLTYKPKRSVGLPWGLPSSAASLPTEIVYIRSRFASDCRDLFLIVTTQG